MALDTRFYYPRVVQAVPADSFRVYAYFDDGSIRLVDVAPLIVPGSVFEPLGDPAVFSSSLTVLNDTVAWDLSGRRDPYDCIDIDALAIYAAAAVEEPKTSG